MLDTSGLQERTFEAFSNTNKSSYLFLCNMRTNVSRWSKNAVEYFDLPGEYMYDAGAIWETYIHPEDLEQYLRNYERVITGVSKWQDFEYRARNRDGNYVVCTCRCTVLKGENGQPDLFSGTIVNHGIIDNIDPITNLHNNQEFMRQLNRMIAAQHSLVVLKTGISMFSRINVMYGTMCGNEVLRQFGERLRDIVGDQGKVYRLDGAKFAVCLPGWTREMVEELYSRIQRMAHQDISLESLTVPLKVAGGAVILEDYSGTADSVRSSLAYALNQSKHAHHGELVFFRDVVQNGDRKNLELIAVIHQSVMKGCDGFYLCYQPLVDVGSGRIIGMEALVRWNQEPYGEIPPGQFIPWLEEDPGFFHLGNWIMMRALTDAVRIREKIKSKFILNVNITASQLERREFRETVLGMLEETGFPPEDFCMELTERCRELDQKFLKAEMAFFHSYGIKLALDDFGTGFSSLELLRELPVDELKVDMSFVRDIHNKPVNQAIIQSVVQCANTIGIKTCIEGVEDAHVSEFLRQYDATYYQGYYYSKPVRIEHFEKLVDA
ncbi:MAG: EAL domain-containing protein [Roseburia sp.]